MIQPKWTEDFITRNPDGSYTAWDETQAEEIGTFSTRQEAVEFILFYASTLGYADELKFGD